MEKLDESYKLKVDLMRHELRVAEEQRELSLNNSKRRGKKVRIMSLRKELNTYTHLIVTVFVSIYDFLIAGFCRFQRERILYDVRSELLRNLIYA